MMELVKVTKRLLRKDVAGGENPKRKQLFPSTHEVTRDS